MTAAVDSRRAALNILRAVRSGKTFDRALDENLGAMESIDRRLAHEISAGVLRSRDTLDNRLAPFLSRPTKKMVQDVQDILRIGAYQMVFLERVPTYAAVTSAVDLAKSLPGGRAAGFVNAVLRKIADSEAAGGDKGAAPETLAERFSHPGWLVDRWVAAYGEEAAKGILVHNNTRPSLTIQPARWSLEELKKALNSAEIQHQSGPGGHGFVVSDAEVALLPGFQEGGFVVQDPTQRQILNFLDVPQGARVWDCCAAPGGKTAALAPLHSVFASDKGLRRIKRLKKTVARTCPDVPLFLADACFPALKSGTVDWVLVDAPCSATGTIAKHPDARWRITPQRIEQAALTQAAILDAVASVVPPQGFLAYVTCSLEPEENESQVETFLTNHTNFERTTDDLSVLPSGDGRDGGFAARLRRI